MFYCRRLNARRLLATGSLLATSFALVTAIAEEPAAVSFSREVAPLLKEHCLACHNPRKAEGGYRVDTFRALASAGDSGLAPLAGDDEQVAELLRRVTSSDASERMPAESTPLDPAAVDILSRWLAAGGVFDGSDESLPLSQLIPPPVHPAAPATYPTSLPVTALAFSADGSLLYSSGYHEVLAWTLEGSLAARIGNVGQRITAIAASPDGSRLAVACGEPGRSGEVRILDLSGDAGGRVLQVPVRCDDIVLDLVFRPDGAKLATAAADKTIRIVDLASGEVTQTFQSHAEQVTALSYSGDGARLASASRDGSAKVFEADSGQLLVSYQGHASPVRGVALLADGLQAYSAGDDGLLHRWNVDDAKKLAEVPLGGQGFRLILGTDGVWAPSADKQLRRVSLADNALANTLAGHDDWVLSAALSRDGSRVASGGYDGEIRLWNSADGTPVATWPSRP